MTPMMPPLLMIRRTQRYAAKATPSQSSAPRTTIAGATSATRGPGRGTPSMVAGRATTTCAHIVLATAGVHPLHLGSAVPPRRLRKKCPLCGSGVDTPRRPFRCFLPLCRPQSGGGSPTTRNADIWSADSSPRPMPSLSQKCVRWDGMPGTHPSLRIVVAVNMDTV